MTSGEAPLGVGLLYNPALADFVATRLDEVDYLGVIPETFWTDWGRDAATRFVEIGPMMQVIEQAASRRPIVAHGLGLSIATADHFDEAHLAQIAAWQRRFHFGWYSEHLSFGRIATLAGGGADAGLALPAPLDAQVLDLLSERVERIRDAVPVPFLLENNVYYVDLPEQEYTEVAFLNALTAPRRCGLLLDLHNLYSNAYNFGFDAMEFIEALDMNAVVEMHIAGGSQIAGMQVDSHAGACSEPVWALLDHAVARAPRLRGITFEFHESYFPTLGDDGVSAELARARGVWNKYH